MAKITPELAARMKQDEGKYVKSLGRALKAARQMHNKQGSMYEKYLSSQYAYIVKEMVRLGISIPDPY